MIVFLYCQVEGVDKEKRVLRLTLLGIFQT